MCSAGREHRQWHFYVGDMVEFSEKIRSYTKGMSQHAFVSDSRTYDATLRNLELIGEAATCIPAEIRKAHPKIHGGWSSAPETELFMDIWG